MTTFDQDSALAIGELHPLPTHSWFSQAALDVTAERRRHVEVERYGAAHDDRHPYGDLARAAAVVALRASGNDHQAIAQRLGLDIKTVNALVRALVEPALDDDLIDAILDDTPSASVETEGKV